MLSIIIPVYNEEKTITEIINKVNDQKKIINLEVVVVDDFSTDSSRDILKKLKQNGKINHLIIHDRNYGKGYAIQSGLKKITGDITLIQDADLEYDPNDYYKMLLIYKKKKLKCLYGSRVLNKNRYFNNNFTSMFRIFANHVLTEITNLIYNQNLTDAHTCYKMVDSSLIKSLNLEENRFAFCPELTAKISKLGIKMSEKSIQINGNIIFSQVDKDKIAIVNLDNFENDNVIILEGIEKEIFSLLDKDKKLTTTEIIEKLEQDYEFEGTEISQFIDELFSTLADKSLVNVSK